MTLRGERLEAGRQEVEGLSKMTVSRCILGTFEGCKTILLLNKKGLVNSYPRSKGHLRTYKEYETIIPLYMKQHGL